MTSSAADAGDSRGGRARPDDDDPGPADPTIDASNAGSHHVPPNYAVPFTPPRKATWTGHVHELVGKDDEDDRPRRGRQLREEGEEE